MLNKESSSDPAAVVAAATLLCNLLVRAAVAAFLKASCNRLTALNERVLRPLHPHEHFKGPAATH